MNRRRALALVTAAVLTLAGCGSASASNKKDGTVDLSTVTLRVGDQKGTGAQALLTAAGLLTGTPYKITWATFTSGPPMLQAIGAGSVDIGGVGDAPPVFAASAGSKIVAVGALRANPKGAALLVPDSSPITDVAQLKGRRIAVAQGSSAHYHLVSVLQKLGLSIKDVTVVNLQPAAALSAFTSGHVDAWDVWSPYIEQAVAQAHGRILVDGTDYGSTYSFTIAARAAVNNPAKAAAIRDYLTRIAKAHLWANAHPDAWAKVWAQGTGLPEDVMRKAADDSASTAVPIDNAVISSEQSVADTFRTAGLIPAPVTFSDFAVDTFNDTVGSTS